MAGAVHSTSSSSSPALSVGFAGRAGFPRGVPRAVELNAEMPTALCARTCNRYVVPFVKSVMVVLVLVPAFANECVVQDEAPLAL